mgnify:CR=1 FL=1
MYPFIIFSKMKSSIRWRVVHHEPGLYFYIIFPIAAAFLLTFMGARIVSYISPQLYLPWFGLHVHHFTYGFFILATAGYLALVFSGPRAKFLIALLQGFGLGLAFDEFGMWLRLDAGDPARFSYDGFLIVLGIFFMIISAKRGFRILRDHLPFIDKPQI